MRRMLLLVALALPVVVCTSPVAASSDQGTIQGTVIDSSSNGLEGARVSAHLGPSGAGGEVAYTLTGEGGVYSLEVPAQSVTIRVSLDGYAPGCGWGAPPVCDGFVVPAGTTVTNHVSLFAPSSVSGVITDHLGSPVQWAAVGPAPLGIPAVQTDEDGSYVWSGLSPVVTELLVRPPIGSPLAPQQVAVALTEGQLLGNVNVQLLLGGTISGTVRNGDGSPRPWAGVSASSVDGTLGNSTTADEDGHYTIVGLPPGQYRVQSDGGFGVPPTFHPSTVDPASAVLVTIAPAEPPDMAHGSASGVDIQLVPPITGTLQLMDTAGVAVTSALGGMACPAPAFPDFDVFDFKCDTGDSVVASGGASGGVVTFLSVPAGDLNFRVADGSGWLPTVLPLSLDHGQTFACTMVVDGPGSSCLVTGGTAAANLAGTVTAGGVPVEGAWVYTHEVSDPSGTQLQTYTGTDGRFEFNVPDGQYFVQVSAAGFAQWNPSSWITVTGGTPVRVQVDLVELPGVTVTGRLVDGNGDGVEGTVTARYVGGPSATLVTYATFDTEPDGSFMLSLPAYGTWNLLPAAPGFLFSGGVSSFIPSGGSWDAGNVVLTQAGTVSGFVTDGVGDGVGGVTVSAFSFVGWHTTTTQADGSYTLALAPGSWSLSFSKPGYSEGCYGGSPPFCSSLSVTGGSATTLNVQLQRFGSISGTVFDPGGDPVQDASVSAGNSFTSTDEDGEYTLSGVSPSTTEVAFLPPNPLWAPVWEPVALSSGEDVVGFDVQFKVGGTISGRVTRADGSAAAGVAVWAEGDGFGGYGEAVTEADGTFTIGGLATGSYRVLSSTAGSALTYHPSTTSYVDAALVHVVVEEAVTGIDVQLRPVVSGTVNLVDSDGQPVTGPPFVGVAACIAPAYPASGILAFVCSDGSPQAGFGSAASTGVAQLNQLPAGDLVLRAAVGSAWTPTLLPLTVALGQSFECTLVVDGPGSSCTVTGDPIGDDDDGVPDEEEDGAPNGGDGNGDGIPDADQPNVTSLPGPDGYITIESPAGTKLASVTVTPSSGLTPPPGVIGQSAVIGYTIKLAPGQPSASVRIFLDDTTGSVNTLWKVQGGNWVNATSLVSSWGVSADGRTVATLLLTDGAFGDEDGVANGVIVDPSVFAVLTGRPAKVALIETLQSMLPTGNKDADKKIGAAIESLQKAVKPSLWVDATHPNKNSAFNEEKQAVASLMAIKNPSPGVTAAIQAIVAVDRTLAQIAIGEAAGGNAKKLANAAKEMAKAATEEAAGRYDKAIDCYRNAWQHANDA